MKWARTTARSPYMEYAKLHSGARYNLAASGVASYPLSELPVRSKTCRSMVKPYTAMLHCRSDWHVRMMSRRSA